MHLYLAQSFQKFEAENFFRNTVVHPPNKLNHKKRFFFEFDLDLNIPVSNTNPTSYEIDNRLDEEMIFLGKKIYRVSDIMEEYCT